MVPIRKLAAAGRRLRERLDERARLRPVRGTAQERGSPEGDALLPPEPARPSLADSLRRGPFADPEVEL